MTKFIDKVGKWDLAGLMTRNLKRDIAEELEAALKMIGLEAEGDMKKYIVQQKGEWEALNADYLKWKKSKNLSNKTLIATSTMVQSITSVVTYPKVFIGIKRGKLYKGGEEVANIAAVHEFGSKKMGIPARPYMRPVHEEMKNKLKDNLLGKRIVEFLRNKYKVE